MSLLQAISVFVVALLFFGLARRRNPRVHIPVMLTAFAADVALVLYIELSRGAIETAVGPTPTIMKIHIFFSVTTVVLYVVQIVTGARRYRGRGGKYHKETGIAFIAFRLLNLVTSFLIETHG